MKVVGLSFIQFPCPTIRTLKSNIIEYANKVWAAIFDAICWLRTNFSSSKVRDDGEKTSRIVKLQTDSPQERLGGINDTDQRLESEQSETSSVLRVPDEAKLGDSFSFTTPKSHKDLALEAFAHHVHAEMATLLECLMHDVRLWKLENGSFNLVLEEQIQVFVPKKDEDEPYGGTTIQFGPVVTGKIENMEILFDTGFTMCCHFWLSLDISVKKIAHAGEGQILIEAGKLGNNKTKIKNLSDLIEDWSNREPKPR